MLNLTAYLDQIIEEESKGIPKEWDTTKVTPVLSDDNQWVPVPKGFTASTIEGEKNVNDGFVIKQGDDGAATEGINEFVWIPVNDKNLNDMYIISETPIPLLGSGGTIQTESGGTIEATTNIYSNLRVNDLIADEVVVGKPGAFNDLCEPDLTPSDYMNLTIEDLQKLADDLTKEYSDIYNSTYKYNGFYVARYELTGSLDNPTSQKNQIVISQQNWYDLREACGKVVNTNYAKTGMIYGNQWDQIEEWILTTGDKTKEQLSVDSTTWGHYYDYNIANEYEEGDERYVAEVATGILESGHSEYWKANNIYDLAGNASEWTQEFLEGYRSSVGGSYAFSGIESPFSLALAGSVPENKIFDFSTRAILYIK